MSQVSEATRDNSSAAQKTRVQAIDKYYGISDTSKETSSSLVSQQQQQQQQSYVPPPPPPPPPSDEPGFFNDEPLVWWMVHEDWIECDMTSNFKVFFYVCVNVCELQA